MAVRKKGKQKIEREVSVMAAAMREQGTERACRRLIDGMLPDIREIDRRLSREYGRSVVDNITWRVKSPESIVKKLRHKHREVSPAEAFSTLKDLAGIRVVCPFQDDVYRVAEAIKALPGYELVKEKNYIVRPKASGYRSIHLILKPKPAEASEPALRKTTQTLPALSCLEIQIRSVAMNYWAILDHQICYKNEKKGAERIRKELKECAIAIAKIDKKMLKLRKEIEKM